MKVFGSLLMMLAGLGTFLFGINTISENLKKTAGGNVSKMFQKLSGRRFAGIGVGAGAGVILESSSATTVILLGLVNAGIVSLAQATLIIMGSNIGTTLGVVVFSLSFLPLGEFLAFSVLVGASVVIGAKKEKTKTIGYAIAGFGLIFIGLRTMSESAGFLKDSVRFVNLLYTVNNPFLLVFAGAIFAGTVQSGTALTGILITLSQAGVMPVTSAFYVILGGNIGSCLTAIIASLGSSLNAKRTALIHLMFNVFGALIFMPILIIFGDDLGAFVIDNVTPAAGIAYFNVLFNTATTLILLPFVKSLTGLATAILPDKMVNERIKK
jgi:Na+/phosphate symporter